jgi:putative MATE family efflux protein
LSESISTTTKQRTAIFTEGSTARHVLVMTMTGAIGTMALFFVDLTDLYFLSLLGQTEVTAAVGYALSILLFELSVALGIGTAAGALVSRSLGAGDREKSRDYAASSFLFAILSSAVIVLTIALLSDRLLSLMGASGEPKRLATLFIWTISPGYVLAAGSFCLASILRGLGDARRAMYVTLSTAVVMLGLDPIFIFGLGWGIQGAATATVLANAFSLLVGLHGVVRVHNALSPISWRGLARDKSAIWAIAYPATLSHLTLPLANAYMTYVIARFGDEAVAGFAIICRLSPVAFGAVFALSSAVGPIIGQNFGAGRYDRVRSTLTQSLILSSLYVACMAMLLLVLSNHIANSFKAMGQSYDLVTFFCTFIGISWAFSGAQFVASAAFNNLGHPRLSALFSWGRVSLGTVPFVWLGAMWGGPEGVLIGNALGAFFFGAAAVAVAYRLAALHPNTPDS